MGADPVGGRVGSAELPGVLDSGDRALWDSMSAQPTAVMLSTTMTTAAAANNCFFFSTILRSTSTSVKYVNAPFS